MTRPVSTVVRARVPGTGGGSFSRSAITTWFSTDSCTMSISYTSPANSPVAGWFGSGGSVSRIRGDLPVADFEPWYTRIVARCTLSSVTDNQRSMRYLGIYVCEA